MGEKAEQPRWCDCDCGDLFAFSCPRKPLSQRPVSQPRTLVSLNENRYSNRSNSSVPTHLQADRSWCERNVPPLCTTKARRKETWHTKKNSATLAPGHRSVALFFCLALGTCAEKVQGAAISQLDVTCTGIPAAALHIKIPRQQSEDPCLAYPRWDLCPLTSLTARRMTTLVRTNASCPSGSLVEVPSWIMECHWVGTFRPIYMYIYIYSTLLNLNMFIEWRNITKS